MKRIAITGVSGYIGSKLLSRLSTMAEIERIVGIDAKPPGIKPPKLRFYCQDIFKPLGDIFIENRVECAIHLVFVLKPTHNETGAWRVDIGGILNFLEACRQARVKHILYLSSHTVYGAHPDNARPLTEDSPLRPLSSFQYSKDKAAAEGILRDFATANTDTSITILRSCPVLGPNAARTVTTSMLKPVMIRIAGYNPLMQFVHEDDLLELMMIFLDRGKAGIFNVAGDGEIQYSEIARLCRKRMITLPQWLLRFLMGFSWLLRLQSQSPTSGLEFIKYPPVLSTEKVKKELGFQFSYSSREALTSFLSCQPIR